MIVSAAFLHTAVALAAAFVLGGAVGLERQFRQRTAGLRTNVLVAVGAAAFVDLGGRIAGPDGAVRVVSYVVSGIGFLGAGVIMKEGRRCAASTPPQPCGPPPPWAPSRAEGRPGRRCW